MKNDSTSDQVINTTATDICDELKNLFAGKHTIKINGEINNETLIAINKTTNIRTHAKSTNWLAFLL